jgi:hypothetical protein
VSEISGVEAASVVASGAAIVGTGVATVTGSLAPPPQAAMIMDALRSIAVMPAVHLVERSVIRPFVLLSCLLSIVVTLPVCVYCLCLAVMIGNNCFYNSNLNAEF